MPRGVLAPCGTNAAHQRHCKRGEVCEPCRLAAKKYQAEKHVRRRENDLEGLRAANREIMRRRRERDPEGERARYREYQLAKYGLTTETWEQMFDSQGRRCACCARNTPGSRYGWSTDHDHETGKVRGILCWQCNTLLGRLGDNLEAVMTRTTQFLNYLQRSHQ